MWNLPKVKTKPNRKENRKNAGECFERNPSQQDGCFGRTSVRKRLLLCGRMQNKKFVWDKGMFQTLCSLL